MNSEATIQSVTITKRGFLSDNSIDSVTLTDEQGFRLSNPQRFSEGKVVFPLTTALKVRQGDVRILTVRVSFSSTINLSTADLYLSLAQPSDIQANLPIKGIFPLIGPRHTVVPGEKIVGRLIVGSVEISSVTRPIIIGSTDQALAKFTLKLSGSSEDAFIDRLVFTNMTGGRNTDVSKLKVIDDRNQTATTTALISGQEIIMDFSKKPYRLVRGEERSLTLRADIVGGQGDILQYVLLNDYDIYARSVLSSYNISAVAGTFDSLTFDRLGKICSGLVLI